MSRDESGRVREHIQEIMRRVRDRQREGIGGSPDVSQAPEGSYPSMNVKQLVSLAALLTASTVGVGGCDTTAGTGSQGMLSQEEATETKADEDMGKNAF